jgi:hypothetical protein
MAQPFKVLIASLAASPVILLSSAYGQNVHSITVTVDESTAGDISLVESFLNTAADETDVSQSLRRIVMAVAGEMSLAVNARIGDDDLLTLNDGALAPLIEDDVINVELKGPKGNEFGPIFGKCTVKKKGSPGGGCRPLFVVTPNGTMPIPPVKKKPPIKL